MRRSVCRVASAARHDAGSDRPRRCGDLAGLALVHFYWAAGGRVGKAAAIPTRDGRPVIRPSPAATAVVGVALLVAASTVAVASGVLGPVGALAACRACDLLLALVFFARAVGDFRYVGVFKSITGRAFARRDTVLYSPLCICLGLLVAIVSFPD